PALVADSGAVLLMPGKEGRRREPEEMGVDFMEAGVPLAGQLRFPATVEGGDTVWLDERTLLVGRGYRTNDAGIQSLQEALPAVEGIGVYQPHSHAWGAG